jgi:predicted Fe-Mo cluster-binding NifX family protein
MNKVVLPLPPLPIETIFFMELVTYQHGAGTIVVKMLVDSNVNLVIAPEFGPGASTLLEQHNIEKAYMKAGTIVSEAVQE